MASDKSLSFSEAQCSHSEMRILILASRTEGLISQISHTVPLGKPFATFKVLGKCKVSVVLSLRKHLLLRSCCDLIAEIRYIEKQDDSVIREYEWGMNGKDWEC